ncbi:MAG TPA: FKBP-type peptidyl-prolyl cis-trans isomerase, partial [Thermoanaerobaculia bacterium]
MSDAAKKGDKVRVHYTGSFDDGSIFDSSRGADPLEFTIGAGEVIAGFEDAIVGMSEGEKKHQTIAPERAYGERHDELVFTIGRDHLPPGSDVAIGDTLQVGFQNGRTATVQVMDMNS